MCQHKYKIGFSLPVYEKLEVVIDQIYNIISFCEDCVIIVHLSEIFDVESEYELWSKFLEMKRQYDYILVNPTRLKTERGDIIKAHISNVNYGKSLMEIEYYVMLASNELFIKRGLYDFIRNYDYGGAPFLIREKFWWGNYKPAMADPFLIQMIKDNKIREIYGGQIEGSFYKSELLYGAIDMFEKYIEYYDENLKYTREEIYFPTLVHSLLPDGKKANNITYINWNKWLIITILTIKNCVNKPGVFSVKTIPRELNYYTRAYIRQKLALTEQMLPLKCKHVSWITMCKKEIWIHVIIFLKYIKKLYPFGNRIDFFQ